MASVFFLGTSRAPSPAVYSITNFVCRNDYKIVGAGALDSPFHYAAR